MNSNANLGAYRRPFKIQDSKSNEKMSSTSPSDIEETAYGVFVQGCWQHHKRIYPDDMIEKEIEEFSEDCSYNWNSLMDWAKDNFRKLADFSWTYTRSYQSK